MDQFCSYTRNRAQRVFYCVFRGIREEIDIRFVDVGERHVDAALLDIADGFGDFAVVRRDAFDRFLALRSRSVVNRTINRIVSVVGFFVNRIVNRVIIRIVIVAQIGDGIPRIHAKTRTIPIERIIFGGEIHFLKRHDAIR